MPANRESILTALRGAKACAGCARYGAVDPFAKAAVGCPECQAALADAVLAAIQPAEPLRCKQCGGVAEEARRCYATPVCYSCLPPPEPLPVRS